VTAAAAWEAGGREVRLSNLDKPLWPDGATKRVLIEHYAAVAPVLLPHLAGRPVTLLRFPDGVEGRSWFQLQWPKGHPAWLPRAEVPGARGRVWQMCLIEDEASLLWAANLAAIELHPLLVHAARPGEPRALVFDLDPGDGAGLAECAAVALRLRSHLADRDLDALVKTSGSLGLHVVVPLAEGHRFDRTKAYARAAAAVLAAEDPDGVTAEQAKAARRGRVLVDWLQNSALRSTVAPYSLRAGPRPLVSTPLRWDEVEAVARADDEAVLAFGPHDVSERLAGVGDVWADGLALHQRLPP
jgi:bifunctional non-homologous end joining protein LigD